MTFPHTGPRTSSGWADVAEAYAATFARLCSGMVGPLLDSAEPLDGLKLLDVGAGTGELALEAARRGAVVTAVEPDEELLALARTRLAATRTVVRRGGLPQLDLTPSYDVSVASFVVNHVADPRASVRELARVTRPGGRVLVSIWPSGATVQSRLFQTILEAAGATAPPSVRLSPELDFPRTADGLAGLLRQGALEDVTVREVAWDWRTTPDAFWSGVQAGIGGVGQTYVAQSEAERTRMDATYDLLRLPLMDGDDLVLPSVALLGSGWVRR